MAAQINENIQYVDPTTGELLVNGYIYVGINNLDAKLNPTSIYSDRELTVALVNPQRTGSDGRSVNKIWIDGKYSLKVEDSANVQKLNDLSLGELAQTSNTTLINVQGADSITADGSPAVTALVNNQVYIFTAAANNTTAVTLAIDLIPTYPIKKQHDKALVANDIEANQTVAVIWNATDSVFELMTNSAIEPVDLATTQTITGDKTFSGANTFSGDNTFTKTQILSKGADITSANDTVLLSDGNFNDITGTTTINGMTTPSSGNPVRTLHYDGAVLLKHATAPSAGFSQLWLPNSADYTTAANDVFEYTFNGTYWEVTGYVLASGKAIAETAITAADGASLVWLATAPASASATLDFINVIDGTYSNYMFIFDDLKPATNTDDLRMRYSINNGSSFVTSSDYQTALDGIDTNGTSLASFSTAADHIRIVGFSTGITNAGDYGISGNLLLNKPSGSTYKRVTGQMAYHEPTTFYGASNTCHGVSLASTTAVNAVRFYMSTGNIASGSIRLYGIKDA